ncbi:MAG: twin-arginine translocase TatA/TatE family subunit [Atopobiaceae bacterium]|jgi:sec-independent protein translocase protein TatA|nr:twin-arginine translocase TatA/TatE family subunit [Atopobiaceae bacterium]MCI1259322.1 twin-arginine translocase TatA/TatE family subunit [Atopobiaceae bacterium]MDD2588822.1 twin-arginine translocase TatA/TatE family subunit [Atopobiaceae bacterium]MDD3486241.1 twin-arginine translocase TatA/TatE family subunit [Atopobiaceae bacterium]MDD4381388.1 twin-arginine translocase TatA/TatE family subunit [Atopobiaceae bacterium]
MILGLGIPELVIILVIILVIFGPKNLPKLGASVGKTVKNIREGMGDDGKDGKKSDKDDAVEVVAEEDADAPAEDSDASAAEDKPADGEAASDEESCFCPKCGTKNAASADFCTKCGAPLHPEA